MRFVQSAASLPNLAPLAALMVLAEIAVGTSMVSHLLDVLGRIGRGFVGTTALICAAVNAIALLILANLGNPGSILSGLGGDRLASLAHWTVAFTLALVADALFSGVGTDAARKVVGTVTTILGLVMLAQLAFFLAPALGGTGRVVVALGPAVFLSGSAWAGMLLGHWYLVTPNLSFRPLRQAVKLVMGAVIVEIVAIFAGLQLASAPARSAVLSGNDAAMFWLLVVGSGVVFTAGVCALTYYFARIRANQPATAMLYVLIISVLMAVVPAGFVFLQTGAPV
jgi:hypothetical protein